MSVDDPSDDDDRVPEHDHFRPGEMSAEARDREECYRDLRAYDQALGRASVGGHADEPRFGDRLDKAQRSSATRGAATAKRALLPRCAASKPN